MRPRMRLTFQMMALMCTTALASAQVEVGTAFTYQGHLEGSAGPVTGSVQLEFSLWLHATSTAPEDQLAGPFSLPFVPVDEGLFTVEVDFGGEVFVGAACWLEITVDGQTLTPRQQIQPAPYALALPGLWTQQNPISPNLIGGYAGNWVEPVYEGAVIGGGGAEWYSHPGYPPDPNDPNDPGDPNGPPVPGENLVTANYATVCGGTANRAGGSGLRDEGDGNNSFIGGGSGNDANGAYSVIGGGYYNTANGHYTSIIGGRENKCGNGTSHEYGVICGGKGNQVNEDAAFVGAGYSHNASGNCSVVCGGDGNTATKYVAFVGGGTNNHATKQGASVLGGFNNSVGGYYSAIVGGNNNTITDNSDYSLVFGDSVRCTRDYAVMFFDGYDYGTLAINRDSDNGNKYEPIVVGTSSSNGNGAYLSGGGDWYTSSKRSGSRELRGPDRAELFARIDALRVAPWEYEQTGERHFSPFAEDFHALFDVGPLDEHGARSTKGLAASDVAGVALAGVQELIHENDELRERVERLEELVDALLGSGQ